MSVEISADTGVVMKVKGQYLAVSRQRRDFHVLKLVHQALYSPSWPSYVPLDTVICDLCGQERQQD